MVNIRANGELIRKLRKEVKVGNKSASQIDIANLSADREFLADIKGEEAPLWINEFSDKWLSRVETKHDDTFEEPLLKSLAYILGTTLEAISFGQQENPYKGLQAFGIDDAEDFGGRSEEALKVFERLQSHNLVGIIGASGSGKSSLAFAGICPLIVAQEPNWELLSLRVGRKPLESLFYALDQWLFPNAEQKLDRPSRMRKFQDNLKLGNDALYYYLSGAEHDTKKLPILLLDQWEELYTLCDNDEDRETFLLNLVEAVEKEAVRILLTVRADFYGELLQSPPSFFNRLKPNLIDLQPMTEGQLLEAIEKPANRVGLIFADGLVNRILKDVGSGQGQLPILQFALSELWHNRDIDTNTVSYEVYEGFGGLQNIIKSHADKVLETILDNEGQKIAQMTLPSLVHLGDHGNDVKIREPLASFGEEQQKILRQLSGEDCRLLTIYRGIDPLSPENEIEFVELSHEELIRSWPKLREWLDDNLEFHQQRSRLQTSYQEYLNNNEDDDFLIPEGKPLEDARQLLVNRGSVFLGNLNSYIERSISKWEIRHSEELEKERQRRSIEENLRREAEKNAEISAKSASRVFAALLKSAARDSRQLAEDGDYRRAIALLVDVIEAHSEFSTALPQDVSHTLFYILSIAPTFAILDAYPINSRFDDSGSALISYGGTFGQLRGAKTWYDINSHEQMAFLQYDIELNERIYQAGFGRIDSLFLATEQKVKILEAVTHDQLDEIEFREKRIVHVQFGKIHNHIIVVCHDDSILIWDYLKQEKYLEFPAKVVQPFRVSGVRETSSGYYALLVTDHEFEVWDIVNNNLVCEANTFEPIFHTKLDSSASRLITFQRNFNSAHIWNLSNKEKALLEFQIDHKENIATAEFSPCDAFIVSTSDDHTVKIWDVHSGKQVGKDLVHPNEVSNAEFSSDSKRILTCCNDNTVRVWDRHTLLQIGEPLKHKSLLCGAHFSPDNEYIISFPSEKPAQLWRDQTKNQKILNVNHDDSVISAQFSPLGDKIVTCSSDRTAVIWDVETAEQLVPAIHHIGWVLSARFSPDGTLIVTSDGTEGVNFWRTDTGEKIGKSLVHDDPVVDAIFSPNGDLLVTIADSRRAKVWNVQHRRQIGSDLIHEDELVSATFNSDGDKIITWSIDGMIRVWDPYKAIQIGEDLIHDIEVNDAAFCGDGKLVASATNNHLVYIWNISESRSGKFNFEHETSIHKISVSRKGDLIAAASNDGVVKIWDIKSRRQIGKDIVHAGYVWSVDFSSDASKLVTASSDNTAAVWDVETGEKVFIDLIHENTVYSAKFSPDSTSVVTASEDGTSKIWDVTIPYDSLTFKAQVRLGNI